MKKIIVAYWKGRDLIPHIEHNSEYEYTIDKQNEIIQTILEHELSVMIRPNMGNNKDILLIYIDEGRFGQS